MRLGLRLGIVVLVGIVGSLGVSDDADAKRTRRIVRKQPTVKSAVAVPAKPHPTDRATSQRAVCLSQCNLERQTCDTRGSGFTDRADQLRAQQSSCFLAVQGCLSRC
jgi:hypothetical protein